MKNEEIQNEFFTINGNELFNIYSQSVYEWNALSEVQKTRWSRLAIWLRDNENKKIAARREKFEICEAIEFLRKEEGDYLTIACENPDPARENDRQQVTCSGFWTMKDGEWRDIPFMGKTLLEALQNAVAHRKQFEGETIP